MCFRSSSPPHLISNHVVTFPDWCHGTVPRGTLKPGDTKTALNLLLLCLQRYSVLISNSGVARSPGWHDSAALPRAGLAFALVAHPSTYLLFP